MFSTATRSFVFWVFLTVWSEDAFVIALATPPSPPPPPPPPAVVTPGPAFDPADLVKRGSGQTCGFISGDSNSPVTCLGTSTCDYRKGYYWGCCDASTCWSPATCEPEGHSYCGGVASDACVYTQIQQCSDDTPSCVTYILSSSYGGSKTTSWACGAAATTYDVLAATVPESQESTATSDVSGTGTQSAAGQSSSTGTASTSSKPTSTSSGGLSPSEKIALGLGIPGSIIIPIAGILVGLWVQKRQRRREEAKKEKAERESHANLQSASQRGNNNSEAITLL
ncbi:hypothetical protein M406DRAFT_325122 [Cryphonectria parasitica EP155]|uniref:Mid2 domain-containing protein n=1 Tax=Cryphonectria parasitica (strain ATCC 38755 / EP155) TaxID=660469 RepID=A0A9P4YAT7_CRYP1|nr:uncharacterized protein M406DRAFT_325122 [Cryphonectria parasitica EP155]KAF3769628.1 hypothetical protein M406DRAFT_325122 [Cryphonectria parasitica EP155]